MSAGAGVSPGVGGVSPGAATRFWRRPTSSVVAGGLYVLAMAAIAAWAAWPIYRDGAFLVLAGVATLAGMLIAGASRLWSWPGWLTVAVTAATFVVVGVPLAVPSALTNIARVPGAFVELLLGTVTAWKDLITVQLPIGTYRNLLVPALVVFLVGTVIVATCVWRTKRPGRSSAFAVAVAIGMVLFGLGFGASTSSAPIALGPFVVPAPRETAVGLLALVCSLAFLAWRTADTRTRALRRAAQSSGVRLSRRRTASDTRRGLLAGGMVMVGVASAALLVPNAAQSLPRDVLRTGVGPEVALRAAVSPLGEYRSYFSNDVFGATLFTVASDGPLPERIRLATLDDYDGESFRAFDVGASGDDARFTRVPSRLTPNKGEPATVRIEIGEYGGIWMPMAGSLASVRFEGPRAAGLADAFYYSAANSAGVQIAGGGLEARDAYELRVSVPETRDVATLTPPASAAASQVDPPESLKQWVKDQDVGTGGVALAELVDRLRARGYLSHALAVPQGEDSAAWAAALGKYGFQPSASGHSLARIDAMFRQLLARQTEAGAAAAQGIDESLVAAVGDDEQFATAVALIAEQLGFPARVVLGVRLGASEGIPSCVGGVCQGGDMSAWVEVQASDGAWVPVDVTPQHAIGVQRDAKQQRDPENVTEIRPDTAQEVVPPAPVQQDSFKPDDDEAGEPRDVTQRCAVGRWSGFVEQIAKLVLGPFATVIAAKALRRKSRRSEGEPGARIVGGWDEYVDTALDQGFTAPNDLTRSELAAHFAAQSAAGSAKGAPAASTTAAGSLATLADRAVFAAESPSDDESADFWRIVDTERGMLSQGTGTWQRLRAAVSLRSFARHLSPSKAARARAAAWLPERRKRTRSTGPHQS